MVTRQQRSGPGFARNPGYQGKALELQVTVQDPDVFTMPWSARIIYQRPPAIGRNDLRRKPPAEIEIYRSLHGWCVADMPLRDGKPICDVVDAQRAWANFSEHGNSGRLPLSRTNTGKLRLLNFALTALATLPCGQSPLGNVADRRLSKTRFVPIPGLS
jgi:hypothetical protein